MVICFLSSKPKVTNRRPRFWCFGILSENSLAYLNATPLDVLQKQSVVASRLWPCRDVKVINCGVDNLVGINLWSGNRDRAAITRFRIQEHNVGCVSCMSATPRALPSSDAVVIGWCLIAHGVNAA